MSVAGYEKVKTKVIEGKKSAFIRNIREPNYMLKGLGK